ncbi:MAG: glycosyltransferase [Thermoanaerobaculia bacterium]
MTAAPSVSIVVPSYNHERFIAAAVASALAQSWRDLEVVVVDDGSTDGSREVVRALATDPRLCFFEQENRGADAAIARGLDLARGEFLFILNSDDIFSADRVERLVAELENHPTAAAACSWIDIIDDAGEIIGRKEAWHTLPPWPQPVPGAGLNDLGRADLALLAGNFVSTTSNLALRRSVLPDLELLPLRYCHDWDLALQLARRGLRVVEEPLVRYRVHPENTLREGAAGGSGIARMHYEILWVIARHAPELLAQAARDDRGRNDLRARFARSLPHFGCLEIAHRLLAESAFGSPASYRALLGAEHPFRREALAQLAAAAESPRSGW